MKKLYLKTKEPKDTLQNKEIHHIFKFVFVPTFALLGGFALYAIVDLMRATKEAIEMLGGTLILASLLQLKEIKFTFTLNK